MEVLVGSNDFLTVVCKNESGEAVKYPLKSPTFKQIRDYSKDINNNKVEYPTISSSEPLPMKDDILTRTYHSPANTLIWAGFVICLSASLLIFLLDDWEKEDIFEVTISRFVVVELEEGKLYYFVFDRFMGTRDTPHQNPISYFSIRKLDHIRMLPKMQTKKMRRSKLLEEIVP